MKNYKKITGAEKTRTKKIIVVDEMQAVYEEQSGKQKDQCSVEFESFFRQGGFNDLGFVGNTQSLEKLPREMVKNATHIFCVYTQSEKERKMIRDIFQLPKEVSDILGTLQTQEMMVFCNPSDKFVIYDRWGRRKVSDRNWFKGKIIPPINHHKSPGGK